MKRGFDPIFQEDTVSSGSSCVEPEADPLTIAMAESAVGGNDRGDRAAIANRLQRSRNEEQPEPTYTELRMAERFVNEHGETLIYVSEFKGWYEYDATRWAPDLHGKVNELCKQTILKSYPDLANIDDREARGRAYQRIKAFENHKKREHVLADAATIPAVRIGQSTLDTDQWAFNVANGTIDLRSGKLREHRPADMLTKISNVPFKPGAKCERFLQFLNEIFDGDEELIGFLQRAVGYSLTGRTTEQCLFLLHGGGANGKSVLLSVLGALLGDYGESAAVETFMLRRGDSVRNDIAALRGVRFVSAVETNEGRRIDECVVKQWTGGDLVTARFLFKEFFTFKPEGKLWLACNHLPTIRGQDFAIWRRIRLIPFRVTFEADQQDPKLTDTLMGELPGILQWALRGCEWWQSDGLKPPSVVTAATAEYKDDQDLFGRYLDDCCLIGNQFEASGGALYTRYREWCDTNGERPITQTLFGRKLGERGFERRKTMGGKVRLGLALKSDSENECSRRGKV